MKILKILALTILVYGCGSSVTESSVNESWDPSNNPGNLGVSNNYPFSQIPTAARIGQRPWSGDYWATNKGGVARRWQSGDLGSNWQNYMYQPLSFQQAQTLSEQELNLLSPAEKYDIMSGDFSFSLTHNELNTTHHTAQQNGNTIPGWFGLCHGWAPAALFEGEPTQPTTYSLKDGRRLTFYASDWKALLTKMYATTDLRSVMVGGRCDSQYISRDPSGRPIELPCRDINPGSWHLVVTSYLSNGQSFVAEISQGPQVWNQPAYGYSFQQNNYRNFDWRMDPNAHLRAPGTTFLIDVTMNFEYIRESAPHFSGSPIAVGNAIYQYTLELDAYNRVIGGEWISEDRPDFLWRPTVFPKLTWGTLR
jgi:hypothetical protein